MFFRLKTLKDKGSDSDSNSSSSSSSDSDSSVDDQEQRQSTEKNCNDEEEDDLENLILERLKDKAKILQELGGEISEEIKELIEPSSDSEELNLVEESKTTHITTEETDKEGVSDKTELPLEIEDELSDTVNLSKIGEELVKDISDSSVGIEGVDAVNATEIKEENDENIATNNVETTGSILELLIQEKAPTSFSLIAGYGNEDDSEVDEDKSDETIKSNENTGPLFPIVENEKKSLTKNLNVKVIKLSAKAKELIHSSTTTGKARATDFVSTNDGLRPCKEVSSGTYALDILIKLNLTYKQFYTQGRLDHIVKLGSRGCTISGSAKLRIYLIGNLET